MASYAQDVKNELAHKFDEDRDCLLAEFVVLLKVGTANAAVVRRIITLIYIMGGRG